MEQATARTPEPITADDLHNVFQAVKNWGRWGPKDERGTLNLISPEKRKQALQLVREGRLVSMSLPLATEPALDNPTPVFHAMVRAGDVGHGSADYLAIHVHGGANTHLDALCHVFYRGQIYNGYPSSSATSAGATKNTIEFAEDGIVSRGVLLDIPRSRGVSWLPPGEPLYVEDLEKAEQAQRLRVEEGDVLLIRTGKYRRRQQTSTNGPEGSAGIHLSCLPWLKGRGVAAIGSDGANEVIPSGHESGDTPVHRTAIPAMGLPLIDSCQLDDVADACAERNRWEFFFFLSPLRLPDGTGSPANPLAIF